MKWNDVFFNTFRAIREKTTANVAGALDCHSLSLSS